MRNQRDLFRYILIDSDVELIPTVSVADFDQQVDVLQKGGLL